jgi:hypothetical protein
LPVSIPTSGRRAAASPSRPRAWPMP